MNSQISGRCTNLILPQVATRTHSRDAMALRARNHLRNTGLYLEPSNYGEPYEITARLLADGEQHLLLRDGVQVDVPVRILQGTEDDEVPVAHAIKTFDALSGPDVTLTIVKGGDHRLSTPTQLKLICDTVLNLAERADGVNY